MTVETYQPIDKLPAPDISEWSVDDLRTRILDIRNELFPDEEPMQDFDADKNYMAEGMAGHMEGASVRYPKREDKDELLGYALEKAQECSTPADGALLLSASVVAIHPMLEGNGRVSRALYADLMGVPRTDESEMERVGRQGMEARESIDVGSAFSNDRTLNNWLYSYPYYAAKVENKNVRVILHNPDAETEADSTVLSDDALSGLNEEEQEDLISATGADEHGNTYKSDMDGMMFATSTVLQKYPELAEHTYHKDGLSWDLTNIHSLLPNMNPDAKKDFVAAIWEQRKLHAKGVIDFIADDFGARKMIAAERGGQMALRDLVVERTNNLHSSTLPK